LQFIFPSNREPSRGREMAGFQRSTTSFRRQGSSGLVWDDRFLSGDLSKTRPNPKDKEMVEFRDLRPSRSVGSVGMLERSQSTGGGGHAAYRSTVKVEPPTLDPPSPKLAGCGLCGLFGKSVMIHQPKSNKSRPKWLCPVIYIYIAWLLFQFIFLTIPSTFFCLLSSFWWCIWSWVVLMFVYIEE